jgi:hypothetical protein
MFLEVDDAIAIVNSQFRIVVFETVAQQHDALRIHCRNQLLDRAPFEAAPTFLLVFWTKENNDEFRFRPIQVRKIGIQVEPREFRCAPLVVEHAILAEDGGELGRDFLDIGAVLARERKPYIETAVRH